MFMVISMSFCITKFQPNRTMHVELMSYRGSRLQPWCRISISGSTYSGGTHCRSKSICRQISISVCGWDVLLLLVSENKRQPYWNSTSSLQSGHCFGMTSFIISPSFVDMCPFRLSICQKEAPLLRRAQRVQFWYQSKDHIMRLPISD